MKRREAKDKGKNERYNHPNAEFQRIASEIRKRFSVINAKKYRKIIEWERLEISLIKLEIPIQARILEWVAVSFSKGSS